MQVMVSLVLVCVARLYTLAEKPICRIMLVSKIFNLKAMLDPECKKVEVVIEIEMKVEEENKGFFGLQDVQDQFEKIIGKTQTPYKLFF